jgi:hypothetical protein
MEVKSNYVGHEQGNSREASYTLLWVTSNEFARGWVISGKYPKRKFDENSRSCGMEWNGSGGESSHISKTIFDLWLITKTEIAYLACNVM